MMTPIQRITRYHLLMKDIKKSYEQLAELSEEEYGGVLEGIKGAHEVAHEIADYANNMMIAGRINGFNVRAHQYLQGSDKGAKKVSE